MGSIKPHPMNPRMGDLEAIGQSIDVNGFYGAVVVSKRTGHILAGNHRYMAARAAGAESVPVAWVDVDEVGEQRILAADNRTSDLGGYDDAALAVLLESVAADGGLLGTGYSDGDLSELLEGLDVPGDSDWGEAMGELPDGDREPFQQMTFTLHDDQVSLVKSALERAKSVGFDDSPNENSNGNALAALATAYMEG